MFKETYYQYKTIFHLQFTARRLQKVVFSGREQRASLRIQGCYEWGRREWVGQLAVSATVSIAFPEIQLSSDHSQVRKGFIHYNIKTPDLHPIISPPTHVLESTVRFTSVASPPLLLPVHRPAPAQQSSGKAGEERERAQKVLTLLAHYNLALGFSVLSRC